jgi:hypothetical protein
MYNSAIYGLINGTMVWSSTVFKIMLLDASGYTFDPDHQAVSSGVGTIGANEIPNVASYASGYGGSGRKTLGGKTVLLNDTTNSAALDASNVTWTALNDGIVGAAVIIIETGGSDASSIPVAYIDNASQFPITTNGGDITIQWDAAGIIRFTNA